LGDFFTTSSGPPDIRLSRDRNVGKVYLNLVIGGQIQERSRKERRPVVHTYIHTYMGLRPAPRKQNKNIFWIKHTKAGLQSQKLQQVYGRAHFCLK
jgi:hypothetical protein